MKVHQLVQLRQLLKKRLTPKRYHHSLMVAKRAWELAEIHGANRFHAYAAGLLHDICHCESGAWQLKYLKTHGILLDDFTKSQTQILHARTGCILLWELGVRDLDILRAVRYHTTGRSDMSTIEKVVFLADATSGDRDYPDVDRHRALADADLDGAMAENLAFTMAMLAETGRPIVRDAWAAYNYYVHNKP